MTDIERILNSARTDPRLQTLMSNCLNRAGYQQYLVQHLVNGLMFKEGKNDSPAFTLGFQWGNYPFGLIFVGEKFSNLLTDNELEFVILHEFGHIIKNHIVTSSLVWLGKSFIVSLIADILEVSQRTAQDILGGLKALYMLLSGKKTIEEEAKAQIELEADKYAVNIQGVKEPAISTLLKLSEGNIRAPTHVTVDGRFPFPITTYEERIEAIRNLQLGYF